MSGALLFDLDGTLVDSSADIAHAANLVLEDLGWGRLPTETLAAHVGWGAMHLFREAFRLLDPERPPATIADVYARFGPAYRACLLDRTCPFPGVVAALEAWSHLPMAVVTNKPQDMTEAMLDGLGLTQHFGAIVGYLPPRPRKPDPAQVHAALHALGAAAESSWMIGDTFADSRAGQAAGCRTAILTHGPVAKTSALQDEADLTAPDFATLFRLLGKYPQSA